MTCWPGYKEDDPDPKELGRRFAEAHRALSSRLLGISDTPSNSLERQKLKASLCLLEAVIKENDKRDVPK
jgi:hypothetical protein